MLYTIFKKFPYAILIFCIISIIVLVGYIAAAEKRQHFAVYRRDTFSMQYPREWKVTDSIQNRDLFEKYNLIPDNDLEVGIIAEKDNYVLYIGRHRYKQGDYTGGGIWITPYDYDIWHKENEKISIGQGTFFIRKLHNSLEERNKPGNDGPSESFLTEYLPVKDNPEQNYDGYSHFIENKNGYTYSSSIYSKTTTSTRETPADIQADLREMMQSITW